MDDNLSLTIRRCKRSRTTKLELNGLGLSTLPQEIYQLSDLETLDISNNKLLSIDSKISNLVNLEFLNISNNQIVSLPQSLTSLPKLHVLNVSGNPLGVQFEKLLSKENQSEPNLQSCLKECFSGDNSGFPTFSSTQASEFKPNATFGGASKINWLGEEKSPTKTFTVEKEDLVFKKQLSETETLLAREQQKVLELKKELDKLRSLQQEQNKFGFQNKSSKNEFGLQDEVAQLLEIDDAELDVQDAISQGGFSLVHQGFYRGTKVAIKKIFNPNITSELMAEMSNEVDMLNRLRHPNIVLLMGVCSKPTNLCIVTEFLPNGSLFNLLHMSKAPLDVNVRLGIAREIALAINFLHLSKIVHRDIKSHNVMLDEKFRVKLGDFGLARPMDALNKGAMQFSGTPTYMAPEIFQKRAYDEKIDVFAFGTMLWELFSRKVPFEGLEPADIMQKVLRDDPLSMTGVPKKISTLIADCRMVDPKKRPSFDKILAILDSITTL